MNNKKMMIERPSCASFIWMWSSIRFSPIGLLAILCWWCHFLMKNFMLYKTMCSGLH